MDEKREEDSLREEGFLTLLALLQTGLKEVSGRILATCPEQHAACADLADEVRKVLGTSPAGVVGVVLFLSSAAMLKELESFLEHRARGKDQVN